MVIGQRLQRLMLPFLRRFFRLICKAIECELGWFQVTVPKFTSTLESNNGWQSGISSQVRFAA